MPEPVRIMLSVALTVALFPFWPVLHAVPGIGILVGWLLIEAAQHASRFDPALRQNYQRLKFRRGSAVAKVAIARKLAVRMYWMLRTGADYAQLVRMQGSPRGTLVSTAPPIC